MASTVLTQLPTSNPYLSFDSDSEYEPSAQQPPTSDTDTPSIAPSIAPSSPDTSRTFLTTSYIPLHLDTQSFDDALTEGGSSADEEEFRSIFLIAKGGVDPAGELERAQEALFEEQGDLGGVRKGRSSKVREARERNDEVARWRSVTAHVVNESFDATVRIAAGKVWGVAERVDERWTHWPLPADMMPRIPKYVDVVSDGTDGSDEEDASDNPIKKGFFNPLDETEPASPESEPLLELVRQLEILAKQCRTDTSSFSSSPTSASLPTQSTSLPSSLLADEAVSRLDTILDRIVDLHEVRESRSARASRKREVVGWETLMGVAALSDVPYNVISNTKRRMYHFLNEDESTSTLGFPLSHIPNVNILIEDSTHSPPPPNEPQFLRPPTPDKRWPCRNVGCNAVYQSSAALNRHRKTCKFPAGRGMKRCPVCGRGFLRRGNLGRHWEGCGGRGRSDVGDDDEENGEGEGGGGGGGVTPVRKKRRRLSERIRGASPTATLTNNTTSSPPASPDLVIRLRAFVDGRGKKRKVFVCPLCEGREFDRVGKVRRHLEDVHGVEGEVGVEGGREGSVGSLGGGGVG
ncbi:hypothetical protein HDV00_010347 [Rhizophlyctis rosea]|nr:hypothetical protein HDV00_010347 [Rhizophlyctis rosea]